MTSTPESLSDEINQGLPDKDFLDFLFVLLTKSCRTHKNKRNSTKVYRINKFTSGFDYKVNILKPQGVPCDALLLQHTRDPSHTVFSKININVDGK